MLLNIGSDERIRLLPISHSLSGFGAVLGLGCIVCVHACGMCAVNGHFVCEDFCPLSNSVLSDLNWRWYYCIVLMLPISPHWRLGSAVDFRSLSYHRAHSGFDNQEWLWCCLLLTPLTTVWPAIWGSSWLARDTLVHAAWPLACSTCHFVLSSRVIPTLSHIIL